MSEDNLLGMRATGCTEARLKFSSIKGHDHESYSGNIPCESSGRKLLAPKYVQEDLVEQLESPSEVVAKSSHGEQLREPDDASETTGPRQCEPPTENAAKEYSLKQLETVGKNIKHSSSHLRCKRSPNLLKKKYTLRPLRGSKRTLHPRSPEKSKMPLRSCNLVNINNNGENKQKKKAERVKKIDTDEFSQIRKHLRYLLNRMSYEQSLVDAYLGEGWKGLSLEKLKPEKELQRANSEILRRKLTIRNLFQRLDSLCAEGRLPKSSFDSNGEISSEDIFCAKCLSTDVSVDNDIILCDGVCDRGFHQLCLVPPVLKEDIPPDDEGWLCPGCDCKIDCIDLLNNNQGVILSIRDCWEKVYPEAATAPGQNQDNLGLSPEDSEDDDYDPVGLDIDEKVQGDESGSDEFGSDESGSDESEHASLSDGVQDPSNNAHCMGIPSEDSEDDDYDPGGPNLDAKGESSNSHFITSESEDLGITVSDKKSSQKDDSESRNDDASKNESINDELLSILEKDAGGDDLLPVRGRRRVERLDYKKLHDETYGDIPTDSSDEGSWSDFVASKKSSKGTICGNTRRLKNSTDANSVKYKVKETGVIGHTPEERTNQQQQIESTYDSPAKPHNSNLKSGSSGNRRLGDAATQGLYKSFKENQYLNKATKESLAAELELTTRQVSKWFENARWSFRHSSCRESFSHQKNNKPPNHGPEMVTRDASSNGAEASATMLECSKENAKNGELETQEDNRQNSRAPNSRKRKSKLDKIAAELDSTIDKAQSPPAKLAKTDKEQTNSRYPMRRRKSVS